MSRAPHIWHWQTAQRRELTNEICNSQLDKCLSLATEVRKAKGVSAWIDHRMGCYQIQRECLWKVLSDARERSGHSYFPTSLNPASRS